MITRKNDGIEARESPTNVTIASTGPPSLSPVIPPRKSPREMSIARMPVTMARSQGVACQRARERSVPNPGITPSGWAQEGPIAGIGLAHALFSLSWPSEPRKAMRALSPAVR